MSEKPIKVLYFITSLESGGSERQLVALLRGLPNKQYEKHVVCLSGFGLLEPEIRPLCASLHDLRYPRLRRDGKLLFHRLPQVLMPVPRLAKIIRKVRPDIIHTLIPVCNIMGAFAWKLAGKGVLVSSRLSLGNYRDSNRTLARFENLTDKYFRFIHCKSRGILEDVLAREPVHREQLRIVYNGIDLQKFNRRINRSDARARIGLPDSAVVIGTVANLKPYKGHSDIVNAAPVIVKQHPRAIFVFVGRDDGIQSDLMAEAAALQIEDRVRFLGERNDVQELMPGFDLLVSASHEEGFSNVLLEAMAARLPVVATRVGGNPEAVEEGVTGYLANPRDPADLGRVINQILGDSTQSINMGEAGRGRVERLFSMQSMLKGMQDLYIEALGGTLSSKQ